jgi:altronate dehydratase
MKKVFVINNSDNVATSLEDIEIEKVTVIGDFTDELEVKESIPTGHKVALIDIPKGELIIKYGVSIGIATKDIKKGMWVHLHCMKSLYDERSSHLDLISGEPKDIIYE